MALYGVVYRLTCKVNGKAYHGQTVNPKERFSHHFRADSHCWALRNAIAKYGRDNFVFEIIGSATSKEELDELEKLWVATSLSPKGYNLREGGANGRSSEETRRKISAAHKVIQNLPEIKLKNSLGVKRAFARPDLKERLRKAAKAYSNRPDVRAERSRMMKRVHALPEQRLKRSEALRASWAKYTPEQRTARVEGLRSTFTTQRRRRVSKTSAEVMARPDVKAKHRASIKRSWTPERRTNKSSQMKEKHADPKYRKLMGTAISKAHRSPGGREKLRLRRRRGESEEAWRQRIES